jgi:hypothetical protein
MEKTGISAAINKQLLDGKMIPQEPLTLEKA